MIAKGQFKERMQERMTGTGLVSDGDGGDGGGGWASARRVGGVDTPVYFGLAGRLCTRPLRCSAVATEHTHTHTHIFG